MASQDREIEIKLPLKNRKEVESFLDIHAEIVSKNVFQKDTYYVPAHRDFFNKKYPFEFLRVRESTNSASINYKHAYPENSEKVEYRDEFESNVGEAEAVKKIFHALNIEERVVVEKIRSTWIFERVEIVLDEVKDLGFFIELEANDFFEDPKEGRKYLFTILEKLGAQVGEEDMKGYALLVLEKQGYVFGT